MSRTKKIPMSARERRRMRSQQIIFALIALMMILAMVISLIKF
jgi:predicted nucleic acid-binding Zn ribbon protein